jgi:hypothetical protein
VNVNLLVPRLSSALSLLLVAGALGACGPAYRANAMPTSATPASTTASPVQARQQGQRYVGVWALVDNANNLFNVRLRPDGRATSTAGIEGTPMAGSGSLRLEQLSEQGRWSVWGNGVRIDYRDGWTDALLMGPAGPVQWSWEPGADRLQPPSNSGKAVRLDGAVAEVVGVYSFQPAQTNLPPYSASLLSNGLAFNTIDRSAGGAWRLEGGRVVIDWISGWRTSFVPQPQGPLAVSHWQPGADRAGAPTGIRPGRRLD